MNVSYCGVINFTCSGGHLLWNFICQRIISETFRNPSIIDMVMVMCARVLSFDHFKNRSVNMDHSDIDIWNQLYWHTDMNCRLHAKNTLMYTTLLESLECIYLDHHLLWHFVWLILYTVYANFASFQSTPQIWWRFIFTFDTDVIANVVHALPYLYINILPFITIIIDKPLASLVATSRITLQYLWSLCCWLC